MKILLPVADDPGAVAAADWIARQWSRAEAPVEVTLLVIAADDSSHLPSQRTSLLDDCRAHKIATVVIRHLNCAGIDNVVHVLCGDPAEAVAQYAADERADLIAISKPPRNAISRTMLLVAHVSGATDLDRLIELAPCPVLVVVDQVADQRWERRLAAARPH